MPRSKHRPFRPANPVVLVETPRPMIDPEPYWVWVAFDNEQKRATSRRDIL
jgi:hypothetical protein